ncbi:MAG: SDR family oxidoreductase [Anaerolineales bacterium]|uniref:SDR family oxidoreductase n=1 Tax=Candidatus Villigracilis vicinus TaxID=3140679 RepID=UPI003135A2E2|nr:SDR family oxidoreductase [Anaerolineales bacterium]
MNEFKNKVALVTGAGSGIGRACALMFAKAGAKLIVADIVVAGGEETVRLINTAGGEAVFTSCDVTKSEEVKSVMTTALKNYGRLDYACNNAGIGGPSMLTGEYKEEDWRAVIDVNLIGAWLCMKYELEIMQKQGGGVIVNMASILGKVGFATASAYVAAKHGLIGLTETAALEYATQNIRVNAVCPGFIYTPLLEKAGMKTGTDLHTQISNLHPMKRMGTSEEIANAVTWLCSDAASFITGHALMVDGGYTAQ